MAKTKRTVEEAEVAAAAAASSASKLITQGGLNHFATEFWTKIKTRYDGTFKAVRLTNDKKLIFTKTNSNEDEINLKDYARLTDKSEFKQDVSADNVAILSNRHIGTSFESASKDRSLGFRQLTTNSFSDGYVDHIRINISDNENTSTNSRWFVWAIKKGVNGKEGDTVAKVIHNSETFTVNTVNEDSVEKKSVIIPINQSFESDTYFIVRCTTHKLEVVKDIKSKYTVDVVNMNNAQPPMNQGGTIDWNNGGNVTDSNTVVMQLFGRESIGTLSEKLNKVSPDSGLYVKHSETTKTGGTTDEANKVVKLGNDGKLDKNMLPSIAINEYFPITEFTNNGLGGITYENGDVVVVNSTGKKYLCIKKDKNASTNSINDFIELNSKDGSVVSVNGKSGEVVLNLTATENSLKLTIGNGTAPAAETSVDIITNEEIDSIIEGLR